ncbi:MAG: 23S rRNA (pseudouridine(1915)-N(3))-methyltransferase RlmH [Bdellovibrionota bacterium]
MKIRILCFGKLKTPGLREACDHYLKLLSAWVPVQEIELKPVSIPDKAPATRKKIQVQEGDLLLARLEDNREILVLLDETGKSHRSESWAEWLQQLADTGTRSVAFAVGSSLGFSDEVRKRAARVVSMGPQTFSHELARVALAEQVYRASSILKKHPYHNAGS